MQRPEFLRNDPGRVIVLVVAAGVLLGALLRLGTGSGRQAEGEGLPAGAATAPSAAATPATHPALRVVCFGDSITGDRPGRAYQGQYLKFADLLQLMIEARLGPGRAEVINSGWAGDATFAKTSQGMPGAVGRLNADVIAHHPDITVVLIGGNDHPSTDQQKATTRANLDTLIARLKEAGIRVLMLEYHQALPDPQKPEKAWNLALANPLIAQAAQAAGVPTLALDPPMQRAAERFGRAQLAHAVDGVHLNPRGEMVYAQAIFTRLDQLGWLPPAKAEALNPNP